MVMLANHASAHALADRYGAHKAGWLLSPSGWRDPRKLDYALDNGAFPAWTRGDAWDADAFLAHCDRAAQCTRPPRFVLVPDVVADRAGTFAQWRRWAPRLAHVYGWPLAFAVQDGMQPADVPSDAQLVFVGGTTRWKWGTVATWCARFPRVHVGRVNTERRLWLCHRLGAESCDGTGWFRRESGQHKGLLSYLRRRHAKEGPPADLTHVTLWGEVDYATVPR
jgi:hypothetical protein